MKNNKCLPGNSKGFTLIELLVVIAILGALASIALISFSGAQGSARDTKRKSDLRQYQTAIEVYANKNNGNYPIRSSAVNPLTLCTATVLGTIACVDDPKSSTGNHYQYVSNNSGTEFSLWATLERPLVATVNKYIVCSNGNVGESANTPSGGTVCPL